MKKRGEIWWVNFDPSIGQEIKKKRPALIISNNTSNKYLKRYQVVPISSHVSKLYPSETYVTVSGNRNKAMTDQLTTVSELRLINKVGRITKKEMKTVEEKIRLQLGL